jgi:hypothetical protein
MNLFENADEEILGLNFKAIDFFKKVLVARLSALHTIK